MRLLADIGARLGVLDDAEFLLQSALKFEPDNKRVRIDYIQALVRQTRESPDIEIGLSPRGAQSLAAAARAHAFVERHSGVFPDDVQAVFASIAGHRLKPAGNTSFRSPAEMCQHVLDSVAIP